MRGHALVGVALAAVLAGCGAFLDLDPVAPAASGFDAGTGRRDAGARDARVADAGPAVRECVTDGDCFDPCFTGRSCGPGGRCAGGVALDCDDGTFCTVDSCGATGCVNERPAIDPCDDGDACTRQTCVGGPDAASACVVVRRVHCDDGVSCTVDSCAAATGLCEHVPDDARCPVSSLGETGMCNSSYGCQYPTCDATTCAPTDCATATCVGDPAVCLRASRCGAGQMCCGGGCAPLGCDDANACTVDSCDPAHGCANTNVLDGTPCPVTDACSLGGTCYAGTCVALGTRSCDDMNPCTTDRCDGVTGTCTHDASSTDGVVCDDDTPCTTRDTCTAGRCAGAPVACPGPAPDRCKPVMCTPTGVSTYACETVVAPPGTPCGPQMSCNEAAVCACDLGFVDCDRDGLSCECAAADCSVTADVVCPRPIDPCAARLCGPGLTCCPSTGACYSPRCLGCCMPVAML